MEQIAPELLAHLGRNDLVRSREIASGPNTAIKRNLGLRVGQQNPEDDGRV